MSAFGEAGPIPSAGTCIVKSTLKAIFLASMSLKVEEIVVLWGK